VDSAAETTRWTRLDKLFKNDHERGETHKYSVSDEGLSKPKDIAYIQVKRESTLIDDHWFLDRIEVFFLNLFNVIHRVERTMPSSVLSRENQMKPVSCAGFLSNFS